MIWILRGVLSLLGLAVVGVVLAWLFVPREPVDRAIAFDPLSLPDDLDAYLAEAESAVPALRPDAARQIVWAGQTGARTPLSIVYLHGFSASLHEIRPVPDRLAETLGANLYFARLAGHGQDGAAMATATAGDWIEDLAEALAIGRRIGERVIVIGTSTGGTLAALIPQEPALAEGVAGLAFVSPNFRLNHAAAPLLTAPWVRSWLPVVAGAERSFTAINEGHAKFWTTRYPTVAVLPMAALVAEVRRWDHRASVLPALFLYSEHDKVVSPAAIRRVHADWGGPKEIHGLIMDPGDDPYSHVIAGDIMSPGQTDRAVSLLLGWAQGL